MSVSVCCETLCESLTKDVALYLLNSTEKVIWERNEGVLQKSSTEVHRETGRREKTQKIESIP